MTSPAFELPIEQVVRQPATYEQYLDLAPESRKVEWVDGFMVTYMPPLIPHQLIVGFLDRLLGAYVALLDLGVVIISPAEVKLWPDGPAREPDLLFVSNDNMGQLSTERFEGGPDLVVEVISRSSAAIDRVEKFREYERAGVREYWLIDLRPYQQQADFYTLDDAGRLASAPLEEDGRFLSKAVPGFWLDVDWLWQLPLRDSQPLLAQIVASSEAASPEMRRAYRALMQTFSGRATD